MLDSSLQEGNGTTQPNRLRGSFLRTESQEQTHGIRVTNIIETLTVCMWPTLLAP